MTWLDDLDATPEEIFALDQALAELDAMTPEELEALAAAEDTALSRGWDPATLDFARELIATAADSGLLSPEEAAGNYAELAGATFSDVYDLTNAQIDHAQQVAAEDARPLARRTEDRLANALGRISRGTYAPLDFASPSAAARELARARWGASQPGNVTGRANCGASDEFGYCVEQHHAHGCGSLAEPHTALALKDSGAYARLANQPLADADNRVWLDQYGIPMSVTDHVEAATGQRLGDGVEFEGSPRRDVTTARRMPVLAGPDGIEPGAHMPQATAAAAARVRQAIGIPTMDASRERDRYAERRGQILADRALRSAGRVHPDLGESTRDRNARLHRPGALTEVTEGGHGALPQFRVA